MRISGRHWDESLRAEIVRRLSVPGASASRVAAEMGLRRNSVIELARRLRAGSYSEFTPPYQETVSPHMDKPRHRVPYRKADPDQFSTYEQIHGKKGITSNDTPAGVPFTMPEGHVLKGVSALVDGEGKEVLRWVKTREDLSVADIVETIRAAFSDYEGLAKPIRPPGVSDADTLTLYPWADWHMGLYTWHEETGSNWDLKIAESVLGGHFDELVRRSPPSRIGVILGGGDLIHADNGENRTLRSGNALDVDGRFAKVIQVTCRLTVRCIDAALGKHEEVIVRILPGNHDPHASVAIAYFLMAWYRDEPRVKVDVDPSLFWWFRFGKVMLGATHGDNVKIKDMPMVMAHRMAEDWGASKFRYVHGFHIHHKSMIATEGMGCICETHQTPAPQDAWHHGAGFLSGRSLKSITYHSAFGEVSRSTLAILDAAA